MANSMDKVNMSLDDIIKTNKGQYSTKRRNGNNGINRNNNSGKKSFGLLNRSKTIQKKRSKQNNNNHNNNGNNNRLNFGQQRRNNRPNKVVGQFQGNSNNSGVSRRRRFNNGIKPQIQQRNNNNNNANANNRFAARLNFGGNQQTNEQSVAFQQTNKRSNIAKSIQSRIQARRGLVQQRRQKQKQQQQQQSKTRRVGVNNNNNGNVLKSKIALQTARKNVQKAKQLLQARQTQMKQILTKRFARVQPQPKVTQQRAKPRRAIAGALRQNKSVRVNAAPLRFRPQQKPQVKFNRARKVGNQHQSQKGSQRMVFY